MISEAIKGDGISEKSDEYLVTRVFNATQHGYPSGKCIPDLLREQAQRHPECTAVVCGDEQLSFSELVASSSDVGRYLRHLGVEADDCVGLFVEPSVDLMVGAWGVLFAGSAYLPLSPEYPEERLRYMIEDSKTNIIFTQEALCERLTELAPCNVSIFTLTDVARFARENRDDGPSVGPCPRDLAYVIYTSGSTGKPKGVMIEHRSIVNQMHWLRSVYQLGSDHVVIQKTPMSFDAAQWEILAPACGSCVVMGEPGVYRDPMRLVEMMAKHKVTTLQCVPTLLQALIDTEMLASCRSLTQIFSGGEALSRNLARECLETLPWCTLTNLYGPTECTINSSAATVALASLKDGPSTISIGAPVFNTTYYILDDQMRPVGIGETGELYIGGVQLARGYLHRPELSAERFVANPYATDFGHDRLYKTGDLAFWNEDGSVQFAGRVDNQVKLRGFRVELDEIRLAIEKHAWVKHAAVIVKNNPRTGFQNLISFVELNPKEAALMDQGVHGAHHQSKGNRLQVRAQLSNPGCRSVEQLAGKITVALPGKNPTDAQKQLVFARKTYRFYDGGPVSKEDLLRLLGRKVECSKPRNVESLQFEEFGEILRFFGQFASERRLLPKYGYASPGALYATQMYFELDGVGDLAAGYYYYHPVTHQLVLIRSKLSNGEAAIKVHFIGKKSAIEPVYKNNIQEVLEIETGHMVGLFEEVLPRYGLGIETSAFVPAVKDELECATEDYYLGTFELTAHTETKRQDAIAVYVQAHPGRIVDLPAGQYRYVHGRLEKISDELVLKRHVIAINQEVYERASVGISVINSNCDDWLSYVDLGRKLQGLQLNDCGMGFMSSGYSSKSGNDLPSAVRITRILNACGLESGPSYFFVGGRVSDEQWTSDGMNEDVVHMKGPAEMIKGDLVNFLPDYMLPNRVMILDKLPQTANGKIDTKVLAQVDVDCLDRPLVAPRTDTERRIAEIWKKAMKRDEISVQDDFFESGGNSLIAVALVSRINKEFYASLPMQVLFEAPTIEKLARSLDGECSDGSCRLVRLQAKGTSKPIICWPGLGGYTMNLRLLASKVGTKRPFYGVQAYGINQGELPYATIREMAAEDVKQIKRVQPEGPYTLWGYSFGARVAFETAHQLEAAGETVENLVLIAPGSPKVRAQSAAVHGREASYGNAAYVTILFSVFTGSISGPLLDECLKVAKDKDTFAAFIHAKIPGLDLELVRRIIRIVAQTYEFEYSFKELVDRQIKAPITIFKACGDDYAFIESHSGYSSQAPTVYELEADHYALLREAGIEELVATIQSRLQSN